MCGRTCMTLSPQEIVCACKYTIKSTKVEPTYRNEFNLGKKYEPSYNLAPTSICPIIVSAKHFDDNADSSERIIIPALWSSIPRWHKGDYKKHGLTTNNARMESLEQSKLYKPMLDKNKRCVMVIEGFYEWGTTNEKLKSSERPVYFIHMPQDNESIKMSDKSTYKNEDLKLLHVAGLFDVWTDEKGDSIYNFTIITFESDKFFGWLHHRTPAILENEDDIRDWLDYEKVSAKDALKLIQQPKAIVWYQVSNYVNKTKNQAEECRKPLIPKTPEKNMLLNWIKKRKNSDDDQKDNGEGSSKKLK